MYHDLLLNVTSANGPAAPPFPIGLQFVPLKGCGFPLYHPLATQPPPPPPPSDLMMATDEHTVETTHTSMDKLAQFVSKSFDGATTAEHSEVAAPAKPAAKNWLVPDSPPPHGIDLRLKEPKARWLDTKTPSPRNSYSSSSSPPIDLEDSKSCPETERTEDEEKPQSRVVVKEDADGGEKKLCE